MIASGRWVQVVKPNGTLVHTSQYWVDGMTLSLHLDARLLPLLHHGLQATSSQAGSGRQIISTSMPSG